MWFLLNCTLVNNSSIGLGVYLYYIRLLSHQFNSGLKKKMTLDWKEFSCRNDNHHLSHDAMDLSLTGCICTKKAKPSANHLRPQHKDLPYHHCFPCLSVLHACDALWVMIYRHTFQMLFITSVSLVYPLLFKSSLHTWPGECMKIGLLCWELAGLGGTRPWSTEEKMVPYTQSWPLTQRNGCHKK